MSATARSGPRRARRAQSSAASCQSWKSQPGGTECATRWSMPRTLHGACQVRARTASSLDTRRPRARIAPFPNGVWSPECVEKRRKASGIRRSSTIFDARRAATEWARIDHFSDGARGFRPFSVRRAPLSGPGARQSWFYRGCFARLRAGWSKCTGSVAGSVETGGLRRWIGQLARAPSLRGRRRCWKRSVCVATYLSAHPHSPCMLSSFSSSSAASGSWG